MISQRPRKVNWVNRREGKLNRVLVAAFEGWNDAGDAATDALKTIGNYYTAREIYEIPADKYYDFQYSRPRIIRPAAGEPKLVWPTAKIFKASLETSGFELLILRGTEPSYKWRDFCVEILKQAAELNVDLIVSMGALLADVPHTRPIPVSVTSGSKDFQGLGDFEVSVAEYEGPIGITGVLSHLATVSGIPALNMWAAVPHYVGHAPSPKAQLALMQKLEDILGVRLPLDRVVEDAQAWERGVNELAANDFEIAEYVAKLEQAQDTAELPEASGDAIAQEFERFLRRREQD